MPTRADFESAAEMFQQAADQVAGLTNAVENLDAAEIVRGGHLGTQVVDRIATSASTARQCSQLIATAAQTCRERAAIIAEYEVRLAHYDRSFAQYRPTAHAWNQRYNRWWRSGGRMPHPGARPVPPVAPVPPPAWADVRRP